MWVGGWEEWCVFVFTDEPGLVSPCLCSEKSHTAKPWTSTVVKVVANGAVQHIFAYGVQSLLEV